MPLTAVYVLSALPPLTRYRTTCFQWILAARARKDDSISRKLHIKLCGLPKFKRMSAIRFKDLRASRAASIKMAMIIM